jgi:hypothetical protein
MWVWNIELKFISLTTPARGAFKGAVRWRRIGTLRSTIHSLRPARLPKASTMPARSSAAAFARKRHSDVTVENQRAGRPLRPPVCEGSEVPLLPAGSVRNTGRGLRSNFDHSVRMTDGERTILHSKPSGRQLKCTLPLTPCIMLLITRVPKPPCEGV